MQWNDRLHIRKVECVEHNQFQSMRYCLILIRKKRLRIDGLLYLTEHYCHTWNEERNGKNNIHIWKLFCNCCSWNGVTRISVNSINMDAIIVV